ncbi:MAG: M20/M25/M40 family metallo-hydrolase [Acidobacteria bacterium]|nr:M20/M25/M40 family metallo-hydrolase [Acidobacteriota bacterium]
MIPGSASALARQLIDIPSLTDEEGPLAAFLARMLPSAGFECRTLPVDDGNPERVSLLATAPDRIPRALLCTHLDTVPPFIASSEDDEWIFGRGACDAKGIMAAMILAASDLLEKGFCDAGLLFLAGEETDSIGAKRANEQLADLGVELVIVGEPTDGRFVEACKGTLTAEVRFDGKAAHSAYPERGESAISKAARAVVAIEETDWGTDDSIGQASANVGIISGGRKPNVVPDEASLTVMIRTVEDMNRSLERLKRTVDLFGGRIAHHHGTSPVIFEVPEGEEGISVGFGTDAPYLGNLGRRILYGPGSIHDAHTPHERIRKPDIEAARAVYARIVQNSLR